MSADRQDHLENLGPLAQRATPDRRDPKASPSIEALYCAFCAGRIPALVVQMNYWSVPTA